MSTGMKKPPVAPKPRLLASQRPAPPPIAPKPEILLPSPSPAALKQGKPTVAPKPCLPKVSLHQKSTRQSAQCLIASKNGGPSHLSHYIIPLHPESPHIGNGKPGSSEDTSERADDDGQKTGGSPTEELGCNSAKGRAIPHWHREQAHTPSDSPSTPPDEEPHVPSLRKDHEHTHAHKSTPASVQSCTLMDESFRKQDQPVDQGDLRTSPMLCSRANDMQADVCVPAAPSKPLPVPQPRRRRRDVLLRQKVVEAPLPEMPNCDLPDLQTDTFQRRCEDVQGNALPEISKNTKPSCIPISDTPPSSTLNTDTKFSHCIGPSHHVESTYSAENRSVGTPPEPIHHSDPSTSEATVFEDAPAEEELQPPAPPPRQMSLPQRDHFTSSSLDNLHLSDRTDPQISEEKLGKEEQDDADAAYGDFARYPLTRSLPKQIKLDCGPRIVTKASSVEDSSPKVIPKKPQRHSLPASALLRKQTAPPQTQAPAPPHVSSSSPAPFGDLPSPPNRKPASRRLVLPSLTLFGKPQPSRKAGSGLVKQRAKSFSSADLLCADPTAGGGAGGRLVRSEQGRRSLRKLLELRSCVRLLPKLLRGGGSLDCTSGDAEPGGCSDSAVADGGDGDTAVEYENVRLYEEIPEYMNLPWVYSTQDTDAGVYEVQEPYGTHRARVSSNHSDEEEGLSSNDEDYNSSTSSKEDLDQSKDREEVERAKRNKVVHIAMEIMSSEKVFVDVLKLLHINHTYREMEKRIAGQIQSEWE